MAKGLGHKIAVASFWSSSSQALGRAIGFFSTLYVARQLAPDDYGIFALAISLRAFAQAWLNIGGGNYLLQEKELSQEHFQTVWTLNLLRALLVGGSVLLVAPLLEGFTGVDGLVEVAFFIALATMIGGLESIGLFQLQKDLTFQRIFKLQFFSRLLGATATMVAASYLQSYWALVVGFVTLIGLQVIGSHYYAPYRHRVTLLHWREMFRYSKDMVVANGLMTMAYRIDEFFLARYVGQSFVGLFTMGRDMADATTTEFFGPIVAALIPGYSQASKAGGDMKESMLTTSALVALVLMPAGIGMAAIAPLFVPLVLGPQWAEAVWILQMIAISKSIMIISMNVQPLMLSKGRSDLVVQRALWSTAMKLILFLSGLFLYGKEGAVLGYFLSDIAFTVIDVSYLKSLAKFSLTELAARLWRPYIGAACMYAAVITLIGSQDSHGFLTMFGAVAVGGVVYCTTIYGLWRLAGTKEGAERHVISFVQTVRARKG